MFFAKGNIKVRFEISGKTLVFILILKISVTNCIPSSSRHARCCAEISSMPLALDLMPFIIFLVSSQVKGCNLKLEGSDTLYEKMMVLRVSSKISGCWKIWKQKLYKCH